MCDEQSRKTTRIRELNDRLRTTFEGGRLMMTCGVRALGPDRVAQVIALVQTFNRFDESNDPHGEHDFGAFDDGGERFFWKIDYYDQSLTYHSEDAADPSKTIRVLTIMLSSEY